MNDVMIFTVKVVAMTPWYCQASFVARNDVVKLMVNWVYPQMNANE